MTALVRGDPKTERMPDNTRRNTDPERGSSPRDPLLDHSHNGGGLYYGNSNGNNYTNGNEHHPNGFHLQGRTGKFMGNVYNKFMVVLKSNYVNFLLVFVPLGILSGLLHWNPTATFVLNFLAIIPLAALLSFATEELAVMVGQTLGGLLNATFGNAVELIVRVPERVGRLIFRPSMGDFTGVRFADIVFLYHKGQRCRLNQR